MFKLECFWCTAVFYSVSFINLPIFHVKIASETKPFTYNSKHFWKFSSTGTPKRKWALDLVRDK